MDALKIYKAGHRPLTAGTADGRRRGAGDCPRFGAQAAGEADDGSGHVIFLLRPPGCFPAPSLAKLKHPSPGAKVQGPPTFRIGLDRIDKTIFSRLARTGAFNLGALAR